MRLLLLLAFFLPLHAHAIDFSKALEDFKIKSRQALDATTRAAGNAAVIVIEKSEKAAVEIERLNRQQQERANSTACQTCGITDPGESPSPVQAIKAPPTREGNWADTRQHTVNNSLVETYGRVPLDATWIFIEIKHKESRSEHTYYITANKGEFNKTIGLRFGKGTYDLRFAFHKNKEKYSTYEIFGNKTVINNDNTVLNFLLPSNEVQSDHPQMIELAQAITKNKSSDLEKSKAIHAWVGKNIAYDVDAYFTGSYIKGYPTDAISVLKRGKSVCQGYSSVIAALHRAIGIPAKIITGITINISEKDTDINSIWEKALREKTYGEHAWNEVYVDGKWESLDATWDSGYVDFQAKTFKFKDWQKDGFKYFFPDTDVFSRDHRKLKETND